MLRPVLGFTVSIEGSCSKSVNILNFDTRKQKCHCGLEQPKVEEREAFLFTNCIVVVICGKMV